MYIENLNLDLQPYFQRVKLYSNGILYTHDRYTLEDNSRNKEYVQQEQMNLKSHKYLNQR